MTNMIKAQIGLHNLYQAYYVCFVFLKSLFRFPYIKEPLENPDPEKEVIFLKDIAYCIDGGYHFLPDKSCGYRHVFLLRHPRKVFASWRKAMLDLGQELNGSDPNGTRSESFHIIKDLPVVYAPPGRFFKELYDLWLHVKQNYDPNPVILDSDDLLSDPATMLPRFLHRGWNPLLG